MSTLWVSHAGRGSALYWNRFEVITPGLTVTNSFSIHLLHDQLSTICRYTDCRGKLWPWVKQKKLGTAVFLLFPFANRSIECSRYPFWPTVMLLYYSICFSGHLLDESAITNHSRLWLHGPCDSGPTLGVWTSSFHFRGEMENCGGPSQQRNAGDVNPCQHATVDIWMMIDPCKGKLALP